MGKPTCLPSCSGGLHVLVTSGPPPSLHTHMKALHIHLHPRGHCICSCSLWPLFCTSPLAHLLLTDGSHSSVSHSLSVLHIFCAQPSHLVVVPVPCAPHCSRAFLAGCCGVACSLCLMDTHWCSFCGPCMRPRGGWALSRGLRVPSSVISCPAPYHDFHCSSIPSHSKGAGITPGPPTGTGVARPHC